MRLLREIVTADRFERHRFAAAVVFFAALYVLATIKQASATSYGASWFDQGMYLRSARAFAAGDLDPRLHWYPPLYSLLAAPFVGLLPSAPFFAVNLAGFALAVVMFLRIARAFEVPQWIAIPSLAVGLLAPSLLLFQFVIPWNTIPVAGLALLGLYTAIEKGPVTRSQMLCVAAASSLIPLFRVVDILMLVPVWAAMLLRLRGEGRSKTLGLIAQGIALSAAIFAAYALLHFSIYGAAMPPYLVASSNVGFDLSSLPVKAFALFVDPRPLYGVGTGILIKIPWLLVSPFGAWAMVRRFGWRGAVAPSMAVLSFLTYIAYADMTPFSFWGQLNYHYYSAAFLLAALCCAAAVADLVATPWHILPATLVCIAPFLVEYRVATTPATAMVRDPRTISLSCDHCGPYRAVEIPGISLHPFDIYQGSGDSSAELHQVAIGRQRLQNIRDLRFIPQPRGGVRLVFRSPMTDDRLVVRFSKPHGLEPGAVVRPTFLDGGFAIRRVEGAKGWWS